MKRILLVILCFGFVNVGYSQGTCGNKNNPLPAAPTVTNTQPTCAISTGTITVNAPLATGMQYSVNGTNYQSSSTFYGLASGTYQVFAKNSNGCVSPGTSVTVNSAPIPQNLSPTVTIAQPTCAVSTGTLSVTAPVGTGMQYSVNGIDYQTSGNFSQLSSGSYQVYVKNSSGCVSPATSVTINSAPIPQNVSPTVTSTQPTCTVSTGTISIPAPVGTGMQYSVNGTDYQSSSTFSQVVPGTYQVYVKNSSGCISPATNVIIDVPQLPIPTNFRAYTPVTYNPINTCSAITDFILQEVSQPLTPCPQGQKQIKLYFTNGALTKATSVAIKYPSGFPGLQTQFTFAPGENQKTFCVPASIELSAITVQTVTCSCGNAEFDIAESTEMGAESPGMTWISRTTPSNDISWNKIIYGNGLFVAMGPTNQVMTSPDGNVWTTRPIPSGYWSSIAYGNGVFVIASRGPENLTLTSPDGIIWTSRATGNAYRWDCLIYANNLFVAIGFDGRHNSAVMTSADGFTWSLRTGIPENHWKNLTYGNGLYVAISTGSVYQNQIITSRDAITWTTTTSPAQGGYWTDIVYGNGVFVAVADSYIYGKTVMTSSDGITWTFRASASDDFRSSSVTYGNGLFVAVSFVGAGNRVMTSPDGITWTSRNSAEDNFWQAVTYGNGLFVAVASSGTGNQIMTSGTLVTDQIPYKIQLKPGIPVCKRSNLKVNVIVSNGLTSQTISDVPLDAITNSGTVMIPASYLTPESIIYVCGAAGPCDDQAACGQTTSTVTLEATPSSDASMEYRIANVVGWQSSPVFAKVSPGSYRAYSRALSGSCYSEEVGIDLTVDVIPAIPVAPTITSNNPTTLCKGGSITLSTNGSSGIQWYKNNVVISGATSSMYVASEAGDFTSTSSNSCGISPASNVISVSDTPVAAPIIKLNQPTYNIPTGTITVNQVSGGSYSKDGGLTYQASNIFSGLSPETYQIKIKDTGGCESPATSAMIIALACEDSDFDIAKSTEMIWTQRTLGVGVWSDVVFGGNQFVAVASNYNGGVGAATSPDGITWTTRITPPTTWGGIAYGNGLFVAVSFFTGRNQIMTSADGNTWTSNPVPSGNWTSIVYGQGKFVVLSGDGINGVMTSTDGVTWTLGNTPGGGYYGISYGNGLFVAASTNGIISSADGLTWTSRSIVGGANWSNSAYGNGVHIVTSSYSGSEFRCARSSDGVTWATIRMPVGAYSDVFFGGGQFVAIGAENTGISTSPDGITWTHMPPTDYWTNGTYGNGMFVAVKGNGTNRIMTSGTLGQIPYIIKPKSGITVCNRCNLKVDVIIVNGATSQTIKDVPLDASTNSGTVMVPANYLSDESVVYVCGKVSSCSTSFTATIESVVQPDCSVITGAITVSPVAGANYSKDGGQTYQSSNIFSGLISGTYQVYVKNSNECISPTASVVINNKPEVIVPAITVSNGLTSLCPGSSVTLTASAGSSYLWNTGATSQAINVNKEGNYTVTIINELGCSATSPITSVTVKSLPVAPNISAQGSTTLCNGASVTLTTNATDGIQWYKNGTALSGATSSNFIASLAGDYTVTLTNNCGLSATSNSINVINSTAPSIPTIFANGATTLCTGANVTLTTSATSGVQWYKNGTAISGASSNYIASLAGDYTITLTNSCGTSAASNVIKINSTLQIPIPSNFHVSEPVAYNPVNTCATLTDFILEEVSQPLTPCPQGQKQIKLSFASGSLTKSTSVILNYPAEFTGLQTQFNFAPGESQKTFCVPASLSLSGMTIQTVTCPCGNSDFDIAKSAGTDAGITWTSRKSASDYGWVGIAYGNGVFVAVPNGGGKVMRSYDGIEWQETSTSNNGWYGLTFGNGLFVAVNNSDAAGKRVMTSPDGITWTFNNNSVAANGWVGVAYGNNKFVAVSNSGTNQRVMTSSNGVDWNPSPPVAPIQWTDVTFGNGYFVAVANSGTGNRVMRSSDGITWEVGTGASDNGWFGVTYGNGLFAAVSISGTGNRVMTSANGLNWTSPESAFNNEWSSITYGNGLFAAVSQSGAGNRVMTSPDGIKWTLGTSAADNSWFAITYGNGLFAAVSYTGTGNRVMTSGTLDELKVPYNITLKPSITPCKRSNLKVNVIVSNGLTSHTIADVPLDVTTNSGTVMIPSNYLTSESVVYVCGSAGTCNDQATCGQTTSTVALKATPPSGSTTEYRIANIAGWQSSPIFNNVPSGSYRAYTRALSGSCYSEEVGIDITVDPILAAAPVAPTITSNNPTTLCDGESVVLSATGNNVIWSNGVVGNSITVSTAGTYTATNSNICGPSVASNQIVVTKNSPPLVPTITHGGSTTLCNGAAVTLSSNATTGIQWYKNGIAISGATSTSYLASEEGAYTITSSNSCGTTAFSESITVKSQSSPVAPTITTNVPTTLCNGASIVLTSTGTNIIWSNGAIGNSITVSTAGTYTATASSTCGTSQASNAIVITINTTPSAPIITAHGSTELCNGSSVTLTTDSTSAIQWYKDGSTISGATSASYIASESGAYTLTSSNSCGTSAASNAVIVNSISVPTDLHVDMPCDSTDFDIAKSTDMVWLPRTSAGVGLGWRSVAYGNGLFVAVSYSGPATRNQVMTSPDGITWTISVTPATYVGWQAVTFGNGLFVATGTYYRSNESGKRVMTSPDGINWTLRETPADNLWSDITFGNGLFVATCTTTGGIVGKRIMTSSNGIDWTLRATPVENPYQKISYGNGLFVAVSNNFGTTPEQRVMTSPDGIDWTPRNTPASNNWYGITYGNGLFVAVGYAGTGNRAMTSPDGINWTLRTTPADNYWYDVTYGDGLFVAVAGYGGEGNRVMTSPDGINWTLGATPANNWWNGVTYGNGLYVAVAQPTTTSGSNILVMTSGTFGKIPYKITLKPTIQTAKRTNLTVNVKITNGLDSRIIPNIALDSISNSGTVQIPTSYLTPESVVSVCGLAGSSDKDLTCVLSTGNITVEATPPPNATLEYKIANLTDWQTSGVFNNVPAGVQRINTRSLTPGGCYSAEACMDIFVKPSPGTLPTTPLISTTSTPALCKGDSILLTSTGSGIVWSNGATGNNIRVPSGNYWATASNLCGTSPASNTITITSLSPTAPVITAEGSNKLVSGSSVTLTSSGDGLINWSNGATGNSITVNREGDYRATAVNDCGESENSNTITVTSDAVPSAPVIQAYGSTELCSGSGVWLNASTSGIGITWSTGATGDWLYVSSPGLYTATSSNSQGNSQVSNTITITGSTGAVIAPVIRANGSTHLINGASVTLTATGTNIVWSTGATGNSITVNTDDDYTASTSNGCGKSVSNVITVTTDSIPAAPIITAQGSPDLCNGYGVTLTAVGQGIVWSNGIKGNSVVVTTAGNYTATASNGFGTSGNSNVISVTIGKAPVITAGTGTHLCNGSSVTLTATGTNIEWSNGAKGTSITVTAPGNYSAIDLDKCGNTAPSNIITVTLGTPPSAPILTAQGSTILSNGSTATLTATGSGTIYWSNGATGNSITVNQEGEYTATVFNECGESANSNSIIVISDTVPPPPVVQTEGGTDLCPGFDILLKASTTGLGITWSNGKTDEWIFVNTPGVYTATAWNSNGTSQVSDTITITASAQAPIAPVITADGPTHLTNGSSVTLTATGTNLVWSTGATGNSITVSNDDDYMVSAFNGCGQSVSNVISVTTDAIPAPPIITSNGSPDLCIGGTMTLTATGKGIVWSNGMTGNRITVTTTGNYTATASNASGTSGNSNTISITIGKGPVITTTSGTDLCQVRSITLTASGNYIEWSNGVIGNSIIVIEEGNYSAIDLGKCGNTAPSNTIIVTKGSIIPTAPVISVIGSTQLSNGSSVTLTALGSGTITWSNGQTGNSITVNQKGNYTAKASNNCKESIQSNVISITTGPVPAAPVITADQTEICAGITAVLSVSNSGPGLIWSTGETTLTIAVNATGNYTATFANEHGTSAASNTVSINASTGVPDMPIITVNKAPDLLNMILTATGPNIVWSNGQTGNSISVTADDEFTARAHNACGESDLADTVFVVVAHVPTAPLLTANGSTLLCNGAEVTLKASGKGILWSNGEIGNTITVSSTGNYTATATNEYGTSGVSNSISVVAGDYLYPPIITAVGDTALCNGSSITLTATGTNVHWSTGALGNSIIVTAAGSYSASTWGDCGQSESSETITVTTSNTPPVPTISAQGSTEMVNGSDVTLTATGKNIQWSNGDTGNTITVNQEGSYTATSFNNCGESASSNAIAVTSATIPSTPVISSDKQPILCAGGTVTLYAATTGLNVVWSNGATGSQINVNTAGDYTATSSNATGTSAVSNTISVINSITPITPTITAQGSTELSSGSSLILTAVGEKIVWSNGQTGNSIRVTREGNYTAVATNDCEASVPSNTITVTLDSQPSQPILSAIGKPVLYMGASVTLSANTNGSIVLWSNGATGDQITVTEPGNYTATSTNDKGTSITSSPIYIGQPIETTPVAVNDDINVCYRTPTPINVLSQDYDRTPFASGKLQVINITSPSHGQLIDKGNGKYVYIPVGNYIGNDSFTYTITTVYNKNIFYNRGNNHYYEFDSWLNSWNDSYEIAKRSNYSGLPGYLATITSAQEKDFISSKLLSLPPSRDYWASNWIGAQRFNSSWKWVTGPENGNIFYGSGTPTKAYSTWQTGYPKRRDSKDYAYTNEFGNWYNDFAINGGSKRTIIEYGGLSSDNFIPIAPSTATVNIIVKPPVAADITVSNPSNLTVYGPNALCPGGTVILTASAGNSFVWSKNGLATGQTTRAIVVSEPGSYTVKVTSESCSATSAAIDITRVRPPAVPVIQVDGNTTICGGGSVILWTPLGYLYNSLFNFAHNNPKTVFKWYLNGVYQNSGTQIKATLDGVYTVTAFNGCQESAPSAPITITVDNTRSVKTSRFDEISHVMPPIADLAKFTAAEVKNEIEHEIAESCESQAKGWMQKLTATLTEAQKLAIKPKMDALSIKLIAVCTAGGTVLNDYTHPMGASTIPSNGAKVPDANFPGGLSSFADAITSVFGTFTAEINPWVLDSPFPYDKKPQFTPLTLASTNPEICDKLTQARIAVGNPSDNALYDALKAKYKDAMSINKDELEMIISSCGNCKYLLKEEITSPAFLIPGNSGCIEAARFSSVKTEFLSKISGISTHKNYPSVFANYMNQEFGFVLSYEDYKKYEDKINIPATAGEILCSKPLVEPIPVDPFGEFKSQIAIAVGSGQSDYATYLPKERQKFMLDYISKCAAAKTTVSLEAMQNIYHYTLYYYDQADNLVRTVPPEGVHVLNSEELKWVEQARNHVEPACPPSSRFPEINTLDKSEVLRKLNTSFKTGSAAVELWLYNPDTDLNQVLITTAPDASDPNKKYMMQTCLDGKYLNVDIFSLESDDPHNISFSNLNHATVDMTGVSLHPWTHLVIQSTDFIGDGLTKPGTMEVYVDGKLGTHVENAPPALCGWEVNSGANPIEMPEKLTSVKYLRLYNRKLTHGTPQSEIEENAAQSCFMLSATNEVNLLKALDNNNGTSRWYRFNKPDANGSTLAIGSTTVETRYTPIYPAHTLTTSYAYNSTNQVVKQETPDGGISKFWYDPLSRLVVSQNAKQAIKLDENKEPDPAFSYTKYDNLGRIVEVGEKTKARDIGSATIAANLNEPKYLSSAFVKGLIDDANNGINSQLTQMVYDEAPKSADNALPAGTLQNNLRKRVSASIFRPTVGSADYNASYYDYDLSGNVKTLWQQVHGLGLKRMDYDYDLVSGKVNKVYYQAGLDQAGKKYPDRFYYQYKYDAENRLTEVLNGTEAENAKLVASYQYYLHGPLARMELGSALQVVQGLDYAYTLQGWLKGVNGNVLNPATEIGKDGPESALTKDAYAYSLGYYKGDYNPIGGTNSTAFGAQYQPQTINPALKERFTGLDLFNGNISNTTVAISKIGDSKPVGYTYRYDQLNRLTEMRQHNLNGVTGVWSATTNPAADAYKESITYDGNGNIKTFLRNGEAGKLPMDNLAYNYLDPITGKMMDNRLRQVADGVKGMNSSNYTDDIESQDPGNYEYDAIGNLTHDEKEGIDKIEWTVYGKIQTIKKKPGFGDNISYTYDPSGNRVSKTMISPSSVVGATTFYVRDAQGNSMGLYEKNTSNQTLWKEQGLYGSSRLGMFRPDVDISPSTNPDLASKLWSNYVGYQNYELSNHLGNVLAVITDKRTLSATGTYEPEVINAQDFYSFGSVMPGRTWSLGDSYRYGFNGKENDSEVKGEGNQQDYGMRIYDPRLGRFLSLDPLASVYPAWGPYSFAMDRPIDGIDLDGAEFATVIKKYYYGSKQPVIQRVWNNPNQKNSYGSEGEGILARTERYGRNGKMTSFTEKMYKRNSIGDHGFYCGPTQVPQVDLVRTYQMEAIDAIDEAGRLHDMGYDRVGATENNGMDSWATIAVDRILVQKSNVVKNAYVFGKKDPFNGQKLNDFEVSEAINVIGYFNYAIESKIDDVSDWMEKNYSGVAQKASGIFNDSEKKQKQNYSLFEKMYMQYNKKDGFWERKEGMWKQNSAGTYVPKTPQELKTKK